MQKKRRVYGFLLTVMRITFIQSVLAIFFVSLSYGTELNAQDLLNRRVTLSVEQMRIDEVLDMITRQVNVRFAYSHELIQAERTVSFTAKDYRLEHVLETLLLPLGIGYTATKRGTILLKRKTESRLPSVSAEDLPVSLVDRSIRGRVTDEKGEGLPGVSVIVKGSQKGTISEPDGTFILAVPDGPQTIIFSFVGYMSQEELVTPERSMLEIILRTDERALDEVVVVGYGVQKKATLTGAVGVIESKQLENRPVGSLQQALQGQVAGLNIVQTAGQPGNNAISMNIRGISTFTNNAVLTIVDGIPSDLANINPSDIESISVLKDAASAAIYGARSSGGVILVTTKTGKKGKLQIKYDSYIGIQQATRLPEKVTAYQHAVAYNQAEANDSPGKTTFTYTAEDLARFSSDNWKDADMIGYLINDAPQTQHNISLSGGSEKQDYFFSLGYLDQGGIVKNTGFKRYNLQLNQNIRLSNRLQLSFKGRYTPSERLAPSEITYPGGSASSIESVLQEAFRYANDTPLFTSDGRWASIRGSINHVARGSADGGEQVLRNNIASGNLSLQFDLFDSFKITAGYGINYTHGRQRDYSRKLKLYNPINPDKIDYQYTTGALRIINSQDIFQSANLMASFHKDIGRHSVSVLGGMTQEEAYNNYDLAGRSDFLTDDLYVLGAGSTNPSLWNTGGKASDWSIRSFLGRANYSYLDKYLLEASVRYDGSSRFVKERRWGLFSAYSAGWIITEEDFLRGNAVLNYLKLRASWGQVGNQNVGNYPFANALSTTNYYFNGTPFMAVYTSGSPNTDLTWETKRTLNIGLDGSIFRDLVSFNLDVFKERTNNILLVVPVPTTYARPEPNQNVGVVDNKGWELKVSHKKTIRAFQYNVSLMVSGAVNKVVDLGGTGPWITTQTSVTNSPGGQITAEGYPINMWYGLESEGLFQTVDEVKNHAFQHLVTSPGDLKYKDNGGDPSVINNDDRVRLGRSDPRFPYGITINLAYKNFDLVAFGQGVLNQQVHIYGWLANNFDRPSSTIYTHMLDAWTPENPNTSRPKHRVAASVTANAIFSDYWLQNAAYFRLKNFQLGYRLPTALMNKLNMDQTRIYLGAENLLTATKLIGFDPELPTVRNMLYPQSRVISLGLNLTF